MTQLAAKEQTHLLLIHAAHAVTFQLDQLSGFCLGFFTLLLQLQFAKGTFRLVPKLPLCHAGAAENVHCDGHEDAPAVEDPLPHALIQVLVDVPQS